MAAAPSVPERLIALQQSDPKEFRRLMAMAFKKNVVPHSGQYQVLDSKARFKIMNCGRRWGKTVLAAKIALMKTREPGKMVWWVAPTYRIVKRGYSEFIRQLPAGVLVKAPPPATNFDAGRAVVLEFKNGSTMEFYSAERPESMLGAAVDLVIMDEAARVKPDVWSETISPTLIDHLGKAVLISTPRGRNWFYYEWLKGQPGGDPDYESWTFRTQDNPTLPPGEADKMAARMPKLKADQEIYAKWLAAGSTVFLLDPRCLQQDTVLPSGLVDGVSPKGCHVMLGVDLARTNDYTVLYGARDRDHRNVFFERFQDVAWEEQRRRIRRAVRLLLREGASGVTLVVDEGNAGNVIVEDLQDAGYDVVGINFTTQKAPMVRLLANDLERGAAFILNDPEYGLTEFENFEMDVTPGGRYTYSAPEGQHDDVVAAKMLQHHGLVNEGVGDIMALSAADPVIREERPTDDPWGDADDDFDGEDFSDLLDDDDPNLEDPQHAMEAIGLVDFSQPPTPAQLLLRQDIWD